MTTSSPQVAVVTGANSGIGRATALHLAHQGYRVFGTVRSLDKAGKLQTRANELGVTVELIEMDVADDASVERGFADIFRATERVDVLVNNAGIGGNGVVEESTSQMYHDAFNVNVVGAIRCTQQVLPN
ncbi:MAG: SDR family NAD(P)-dependent oxidoreductase, partial [Actinomycetota bacterium]